MIEFDYSLEPNHSETYTDQKDFTTGEFGTPAEIV